MDDTRRRPAISLRPSALAALGAVLFALLYFSLARPLAAGILYDDGIYMMGAIAMAAGKGHILPWIEGIPVVYKYPPLFPAVLSIPALFLQSLQAKITAFLALNFLFSLGALGLVFLLYRRHYGFPPLLCMGLLLMVATSFRLLEPATAVMSEPLYLLLTTGLFVIYLQPQASKDAKDIHWPVVLLGLLAFYTRTIGILALGAVVLHRLAQGRVKSATLYGACFAIGAFPWFHWSGHQPENTLAINDFLVRTFLEGYTRTLRMDLQYEHDLLPLYGNGFTELVSDMALTVFPWLDTLRLTPNNAAEGMILILSLGLCALLLIRLARCVIQREFSLIGIYLVLYLLALPLWSFHDQYPRFLAVILPFLLPQFILLARHHLAGVRQHAVIGAFLALGIATNLLQDLHHIRQDNARVLADYHAVFDWLEAHTDPEDVLWTDNTMDSVYLGLWTQRPALDFFVFYPRPVSPDIAPQELQALFRRKADVLYRMLAMNRVRYIVINRAILTRNQLNPGRLLPKNEPATDFLMRDYAGGFEQVAESPNGLMTVYRTRFVLPRPANSE